MTPEDCFSPDWTNKGKVHDWKNYANDGLIEIWDNFTQEQKRVIAKNLQDVADQEEWE
ncbi:MULTISPECIES: recombinase RecA [Klebsiella/Raoultella group]|uniref:recombinase RecA n=1 Tax=Klebsiella/Raoultella group TaxID=2890311 RepID=UPI0010AE6334|nr:MULTISPECIES: recombinase RecA [Klebsiella/Raoultella group]MBE0323429.1 recombinase RecA [Klebsiella pneumoniae]MBE0327987.1 recombinase RecA [Klebsiella pneumoniae]TJZ71975.1 recombinase RecA [Raoultella planticola]HED2415523.1 recombinase RecA [Raoultella planticola]